MFLLICTSGWERFVWTRVRLRLCPVYYMDICLFVQLSGFILGWKKNMGRGGIIICGYRRLREN